LWGTIGFKSFKEIWWNQPFRLIKDLGANQLPTSVSIRNCPADKPAIVYMVPMIADNRDYLRDEPALIYEQKFIGAQRIQPTTERWMELSPRIRDLKLIDTRLIGSHDALSSDITKKSPYCIGYARAKEHDPDWHLGPGDFCPNPDGWIMQSESILEQLRDGVRMFDIRMAKQSDMWYGMHVYIAIPIVQGICITSQIFQFLQECPQEVIILYFNECWSDNTGSGVATKNEQNELIGIFRDYLPLAPWSGDPLNQTINQILSRYGEHVQVGRVIFIPYDRSVLTADNQKYAWEFPHSFDGENNDGPTLNEQVESLRQALSQWYSTPYSKFRMLATSCQKCGYRVDNAAKINPLALQLALSDTKAHYNGIRVNDATNTPDWIRVFILNWMNPPE
jgi:hypothetical protein